MMRTGGAHRAEDASFESSAESLSKGLGAAGPQHHDLNRALEVRSRWEDVLAAEGSISITPPPKGRRPGELLKALKEREDLIQLDVMDTLAAVMRTLG